MTARQSACLDSDYPDHVYLERQLSLPFPPVAGIAINASSSSNQASPQYFSSGVIKESIWFDDGAFFGCWVEDEFASDQYVGYEFETCVDRALQQGWVIID